MINTSRLYSVSCEAYFSAMKQLTQFTHRQLSLITLVFCLLLSGLVVWQTTYWTTQVVSDEIRSRSLNTLKLVVSNLSAELRRFRSQPELISADKRLIPVLKGSASAEQMRVLNRELARINHVSGASDTYLMNNQGVTVAASNWQSTSTFIGRNFNFRPYFQLAMQGKLGTYFGLGSISKARGYFFAYPVREGMQILGVVVVKITVAKLEKKWRQANDKIAVLDQDGVVFLASDQDWHLHMFNALSDEELMALENSRRYARRKLEQLPIAEKVLDEQGQLSQIILWESRGRLGSKKEHYLVEQLGMNEESWQVVLLANHREVSRRVQIAVAVSVLMLASLFLAGANIMQRRRRLAERMAMKDAHSRELEHRVIERTEALSQANQQLRSEIKEREYAEAELRETQAGLVQATKLAALGQMSAGLSHELNQPLAAIRSYSDNAKAFIDRGNIQTASDNLQLITELADRMGRIIKNLRTYARDESISTRPVVVVSPLQESLRLLAERIKSDEVSVDLQLPEASPVVMAGDVRLQQVFVNIISNALDSMRNSPQRRLDIGVSEQADNVHISLADTGAGVPQALREHVFDPFYSTKSVGEGMGLGLSITYGIVDQFGGKILIDDSPSGGALFTIILKKAN